MAPLAGGRGKYGLGVVEDATESLGSTWQGRACGSFGHSAVLCFNGNKIITTGGGGMILTEDDELCARRARHFTTTAKKAHAWSFDHDEVGYNYRLPNINAALGCAQMEKLPELLTAKRRLAERYLEVFDGVPGARIFREPEGAQGNYWLNTLVLDARICRRARSPVGRTACAWHSLPSAVDPDAPAADVPRLPACAARRRRRHPRALHQPAEQPVPGRERESNLDAPARLLHHSPHDAVVDISGSRIDFADVTVLSDLRGEGDYSLVDDFYRFMRKGDAAAVAIARFGEDGCADIILRCRSLRSLDRDLAMRMIGGMTQAICVYGFSVLLLGHAADHPERQLAVETSQRPGSEG